MFNQSLACCLPMINQLKEFLGTERGVNSSLDFRESIVASFIEFERKAVSHNIDIKKITHIKYALAALTDECVMNSVWPGKLSWMRRSLQLEFFGVHVAGEGFFERLSQLRQAGSTEVDVLEIYALCLQLGFQGIYRFKDKTQFTALIAGLESQIDVLRGKSDLGLSSSSTLDNSFKKTSREIPLWWVAIVALTIIFFILAGYSVVTHIQLRHAVQLLNPELGYDR